MSGPLVVLLWAAINFVIWVVGWSIFEPDAEAVAVYASGIVITLIAAALGALAHRRMKAPGDREPSAVPDSSSSAALLGIAVAAAMLATEFGPWLAYGALLAFVFAIGGLVRELRAQREQQHQVRLRHPHASERTNE